MKEKTLSWKRLFMIFLVVGSMFLLAQPCTVFAFDYFVYSEMITSCSGSYGVDGYVGSDGKDRIIFYCNDYVAGTATAYIYKVEIPAFSDPNMHPDNPLATGPIAPRTFTLDKTFDLGVVPGHECEFY